LLKDYIINNQILDKEVLEMMKFTMNILVGLNDDNNIKFMSRNPCKH